MAQDIQRRDSRDRAHPELSDDKPLGSTRFGQRFRCDQWGGPLVRAVLGNGPRTGAHLEGRRGDSGGLCHSPEALSSTGDDSDRPPERLDRTIDRRRAFQICAAGSFVGPARSRHHLVSAPERWAHAGHGAVHGLCDHRLLETDSSRELFRQRTSICDDDSLGTDAAIPVPACATTGSEQSGVCGRFQRNQDVGCSDRLASTTGTLDTGGVLER